MSPHPRLPFNYGRGLTKATNEEIVAAYRETGSVWATAKRLGMCGQSVWERLRALGHQLPSAKWTDEEIAQLQQLAGDATIGEIATRLGRPYAGVACKISELQLGSRYGNRQQRRRQPGGYAKKRVLSLINQLESYGGSLRQFSAKHALDIETFIRSIQRFDREFWDDYTRRRSDLTEKICPNCREPFYPFTSRQRTCSRKCSDQARVDADYFGGKRQQTIGLAAGICQLCMSPTRAGLSSHHVLGKENDPENNFLIALCRGCHQLVGMLAGRRFSDSEQGWENLINLVMARRLADKNHDAQTKYVGTHVAVDIDWLTREDLEATGALEEAAS